jgi:peptidyl-tRNA hydrolase
MPVGKAVAQAGHAFLESFLAAPPERQARYRADGLSAKVTLALPPEADLEPLLRSLQAAGLPAALIGDHGHVMPPHFTDAPIATARGIGPIAPWEAPTWVRRRRLFGHGEAAR